MSVKKSVEKPLQTIGDNNKLLKRATGKDPGIDRKCVGGAELSNNDARNKISSFKNGCVARVVLKAKEPRCGVAKREVWEKEERRGFRG